MCVNCDLYDECRKVANIENENSALNETANDMVAEIVLWRVIGNIAELNAALDELSKENKNLTDSHDLLVARNSQLFMNIQILTSRLASERLANKKLNAKLRHPSNGNVNKS